MSRILVIAEHDGRHVLQSTARCMSCAVEIDRAGADVAVFAAEAGTLGTEAASIRGVKKVTLVLHPAHAAQLAAVLAPQIAAMAHDYDYVLGPSTTFGKDLMPRVAALLGAGPVSDVMAVLGRAASSGRSTRAMPSRPSRYGGRTVVATVGGFLQARRGSGEGAIETVNATSRSPPIPASGNLKPPAANGLTCRPPAS